MAIRAASTRLGCPPPIPIATPFLTNTMALLQVAAATCHANNKSVHSVSVGVRSVATVYRSSGSSTSSVVCTNRPPSILRTCNAFSLNGAVASSSRRDGFAHKISSAPALNPGATTTSVNTSAIARAVSSVTARLRAMIPPKALIGSAACAAR